MGDAPLNRARRNAVRILSTAVLVLAVAVGFLATRDLGENARIDQRIQLADQRARLAQDSTCGFWWDLSTLPLAANAGETALRIVADSRIAYDALGCAVLHGFLPSPDPRLLPYLPPNRPGLPSPSPSN